MKKELKARAEVDREVQKKNYVQRQAAKYKRFTEYSLDPENRQKYEVRAAVTERNDERIRMRGYGKAPKYVRNDEIDACETTDAIEKLFPEISFMDGYRKMPIRIQKEIAQGFGYMRNILGAKAMPVSFNASRTTDYGKTKWRLQMILHRKLID